TYLGIPDGTVADLQYTDFTIDFWIRVTGSNAFQWVLYKTPSPTDASPIAIRRTAAGTWGVEVYSSIGGAVVVQNTSFGSYTVNTWQHHAFVKKGSAWAYYLD